MASSLAIDRGGKSRVGASFVRRPVRRIPKKLILLLVYCILSIKLSFYITNLLVRSKFLSSYSSIIIYLVTLLTPPVITITVFLYALYYWSL